MLKKGIFETKKSCSSTSIRASCKNQTENEFHPLIASQVFCMFFYIQEKVKPWARIPIKRISHF
jgi:hypothetical protein